MSGLTVFRIEGERAAVRVAAGDVSRESYFREQGTIPYSVSAILPGGMSWCVSAPVGLTPGLLSLSTAMLRRAFAAHTLLELTRRQDSRRADLVKLDWDDPDFVVAVNHFEDGMVSLVVSPVFWKAEDVQSGTPAEFEIVVKREQLLVAAEQIDAFLEALSERLGQ